MPSTYTCGTCRTSFESGRVNWSSPTCGPCEATARAQQRREGLSDARFMRQSPRGGVPRAPRGVPRRGPPGLRQLLPHHERHTWVEHHRVRADPIVELPPPSPAYLATASEPSESLSPALGAAAQLGPLVVALCLSRTLLYRPNGYTRSGQYAVVRPYLATFLSYLVRARARAEAGEGRRIQLVVYSAARSYNTLDLLQSIELFLRRLRSTPTGRTARLVATPRAGRTKRAPVVTSSSLCSVGSFSVSVARTTARTWSRSRASRGCGTRWASATRTGPRGPCSSMRTTRQRCVLS
ncbi:hypothetical protein DMC30DRAFT_401902 [Rhodotorula diobovata]|uniref:Uncharacterized protein n=1 Tax=Rhodotorula diobovata TaxID=5288 RepID=A0A5C5FQL0_9BASI|nr:hypothetical protein DMC30DRAFT_401902 [Rhodotorula diobovata]